MLTLDCIGKVPTFWAALSDSDSVSVHKGTSYQEELLISFAHFSHYTHHEKFLNPLNLLLSLPQSKFRRKKRKKSRAESQINEQQCNEYFTADTLSCPIKRTQNSWPQKVGKVCNRNRNRDEPRPRNAANIYVYTKRAGRRQAAAVPNVCHKILFTNLFSNAHKFVCGALLSLLFVCHAGQRL